MNNKGKIFVRYLFWSFSLAIMTIIFFFSSQTAEQSATASGGLLEKILNLLSSEFANASDADKILIIEAYQLFIRKAAHFTIYALLGFCLFTAIFTYNIHLFAKFSITLPISLLYAVSDEIHQMYIPGRGCMIEDVLLDFCGSVVGALIAFLLISIIIRIKNRRKQMRKTELMKRLSELVQLVDELNRKVRDLSAENDELRRKLESINDKPEQLADNNTNDSETIDNEQPIGECFSVKKIEEIDFDSVKELPVTEIITKDEPILQDDALEYGAEVIGKITVESAKYCDKITANGGANQRELLGLVMGKSEVCKNDILSIAMSETAPDTKRELIDAQLTEALEYFKSLAEQGI